MKLVEELRLVAATEDFSAIRRVSVNRRGSIAVPLPQEFQIRSYDSTGRRTGAIGRKGAGPGEFQDVSAVSWVGDTLFVFDMGLHRVSYFGPDNRLLRTVAIPRGLNLTAKTSATDSTIWGFSPFAAFANGEMIGEARLNIGRTSESSRNVLVAQSSRNTFRLIATPPSYDDERWMMWYSGFGNTVPFVLQPQVRWASDGSKIAFLTADQRTNVGKFFVAVHDSGGKLLYEKSFSYRGIPIPGSVADSAINASFPLRVAVLEGPPNSQWQTLAKKRMPATFSLVERIVIGGDGRTWLTLRATPSGQEVVVLDARGAPSAVVSLPRNARIEQTDASQIWVTQRDGDGLPSVVRYRMRR